MKCSICREKINYAVEKIDLCKKCQNVYLKSRKRRNQKTNDYSNRKN